MSETRRWSAVTRAIGLALLVWMTRSALAEGMALLVPAYFDPVSSGWAQLADAATRAPLVAIANVYNGPGVEAAAQPDYRSALAAVRAAGGQVIGYVYTQYAKRSVDVVKTDMRRWHEHYPIDGFFVDEMSNDTSVADVAYYRELLRYARELKSGYRVIGNPGTNTEEAYLKEPAADVVVIFENGAGYPEFVPSAWTKLYPPTQLGHLAYGVAAEQMAQFINLAAARRAGFVYLTDDSGNNPWDTLPSYWRAEVDEVQSMNRAAAERTRALLTVARADPILTVKGQGAVGRYVLETSSPLGDWRPLGTNLTNTGTSVWQVLNVSPNRFFRLRQD